MTTPQKLLNIKHSEKVRKEYIASFKMGKHDKSNKVFAELLMNDFSNQLIKLENK